MNVLIDILEIIQLAFYLYIISSVLVLFVFSSASLFPYKPKLTDDGVFRKMALIIPAYNEDNVILEVVKSAREQKYPNDKFDIVVVADHFLPETLQKLSKYNIILLAKDFEISTKSRALNYAFDNLKDDYDIAVVLDADNIMSHDFLSTINRSFATGYMVVQGHRTAKNLNTSFALLDSISEEINNSIFRKGFRNLNFSSALIVYKALFFSIIELSTGHELTNNTKFEYGNLFFLVFCHIPSLKLKFQRLYDSKTDP